MQLKLIFGFVSIVFFLSSCAGSTVKNKMAGEYKKHDIVIKSNPPGADIFIYPQGIIAQTPLRVNRLEVLNATIDAKKSGYQDTSLFVEKKESFMPVHTFFGNLILLPLYPFAVLYDLKHGWAIEKPSEEIIITLEKK